MADQKESSVLFSLKELMNLEEDRIREEEADKARRAKAEFDAKESADRVAREAEERRLREEEDRRRQEELRKREEAARIDAIRHGELEKARAEAEAKSRLESMAQQQAHEAQLATIHQDKGKKRLQVIVGIVAFVLIAGLVGGGFLIKAGKDREARAAAENAQLAAGKREAEERASRLESDMKASQEKESALRADLASAKSDADRARIQGELNQAEAKTAQVRQGLSAVRKSAGSSGGGGTPKPAKASNCAPGDPMCAE
jgi:colicin import membrane protein